MTSQKSLQLLPVVLKSQGSQYFKYRCLLFSTEADTHELCIAISYYLIQENCYSNVCASIVGGGAFIGEYKIMSQVVTNVGQNSRAVFLVFL